MRRFRLGTTATNTWIGGPSKKASDGTMVEPTGESRVGIDISRDGKWGYHRLIASLAQTGDVLSVLNRPGNRPSHKGAAAEVDRAIRVCLTGDFQRVLLRGDTDFSQTRHLDRWTDDQRVQFIFELDRTANRHFLADELPGDELAASPACASIPSQDGTANSTGRHQGSDRARTGIRDHSLRSEDVAEMPYRPVACQKDLSADRGPQEPDNRTRRTSTSTTTCTSSI